ncbi:PH domain-containing protein [Burkholderia cenocepacia]|uniref:PH domain-containing protein n=1 Tax=Burkholderia cenocepacia TaxID=95486 RepID=UPI001AA1D053|nr:PH domain-containing protein [Burkholderia cenocepacia]MBO1859294.1 PH domain-containing protein [Burkholderia cenocepacia]
MESMKSKGRQVFSGHGAELPPVYAKADVRHQLGFVPSLYTCIPAALQTWLLLLVIVAGYGLVNNYKPAMSPPATQAQHGRVHKQPTHDKPASNPANIPTWWLFTAAGGFVLLRFGWGILATRSRSITIEPARLTFRRGVLNREVRSLEMTRVKNVSSYQRWWQRPFGIGTVIVESTDQGNRLFVMDGMTDPHDLRERILRAGVASRQFYGTTETWVSAF